MSRNLLSGVGSYQLINILIAGVIILIFIYSSIFNSTDNNYPINCIHQELTGLDCPSCGLSRSFSETIRFNFDEAQKWNSYGIKVFAFFIFQLALRIFNISYLRRLPQKMKALASFDITISTITFVVAFWQFIEYNFRLVF